MDIRVLFAIYLLETWVIMQQQQILINIFIMCKYMYLVLQTSYFFSECEAHLLSSNVPTGESLSD